MGRLQRLQRRKMFGKQDFLPKRGLLTQFGGCPATLNRQPVINAYNAPKGASLIEFFFFVVVHSATILVGGY